MKKYGLLSCLVGVRIFYIAASVIVSGCIHLNKQEQAPFKFNRCKTAFW